MASTSLIGRRPLLRGIAASAAAGLLGIASDGGAEVPGPGASGRPRPTQADWRVLRRHLDGELLRPHGGGYALAARLYDPRYDSVRPAAVVEAAHADDVSTVLAFARRFGLPVRAKSGGHSYVGASTVRDGLVISTTALQAVRYDSGSRRVGVGAGARLIDVHTALDRHGRTVPTGTCPTVGATGLTLGGGIGLESRAYGLTCDALQEAVVVTADGRRHTA
ncbi:MAG: FAD-binding oxidoreductase, partial [Nocardioidaceae bacterium]